MIRAHGEVMRRKRTELRAHTVGPAGTPPLSAPNPSSVTGSMSYGNSR